MAEECSCGMWCEHVIPNHDDQCCICKGITKDKRCWSCKKQKAVYD